MNARFLPAILSVCAIVIFAGCHRKPLVDEREVFSAIQENVTAMQNKDTAGVMATVHSEGPDFASTREVIGDLFKQYDLHYTLSDLKVVSATPDEVKVSFTQKTEKVSGAGEFPGMIVEGVHTLRKEHGIWKIYKTAMGKTTPLPAKS